MDEFSRDFKGVWIPKEIWLDNRLNSLDKIILVEIDSLDATEDGCYASNQYLAEFCQCSETKISTAINKLVNLGYIEIIKFDGRKRYIKSRIKNFESLPLKNLKSEFKKIKDINIYNNINNNLYIYIINYLNAKAKTNYRNSTNKTKNLIKARINEGFTKDDFIKVIDNKVQEWLNTDMEKYLRPETLFGTKFESYLNQKTNKLPSWYKKEYKKEELDDNELQEMKELMKDFK